MSGETPVFTSTQKDLDLAHGKKPSILERVRNRFFPRKTEEVKLCIAICFATCKSGHKLPWLIRVSDRTEAEVEADKQAWRDDVSSGLVYCAQCEEGV